MNQFLEIFSSSVGRKYVVAITSVFLGLFIMVHLMGNFLLFLGPQAFNTYSHFLINHPLILPMEFGLATIFLIHIFFVGWLTLDNIRARPRGYKVGAQSEKAATIASRTMIFHGSLIFVFLIYHLVTFKWGPYYEVDYEGIVMRDIYRVVVESFSSIYNVGWYLLCMYGLYLHLSHGASSFLQTLGANNKSLARIIKSFGYAYAMVVAGGFFIIPVAVFFITTKKLF